jgi:hypothetical protein
MPTPMIRRLYHTAHFPETLELAFRGPFGRIQ